MICQQCGSQRAAAQPSCSVCGSMPLLRPSQERPMVMPSGPEVSWIPSGPTQATTLFPVQTSRTALREASARVPGRTLQGQQYHLLVQQEQRQWNTEISETWWLAKDTERGNAVTVCEVALPLGGSDLLTFFRVATKAVMRRSTHPHMSALLTVFLEQGHGFFVFAHPAGEPLQASIGRRRLLTEQEALDCYGQLADALWFFSEQHPPLVHGSIQPEHVVQVGSHWVLTHASPLVAGGVMQCVPALRTTQLAGQSTPAADLALLSTAIYSVVIGRVPPDGGAEQQAQVMRAGLSPTFAAILLKGVHPRPQERYQSASNLLEALGHRPTRSNEDVRRQRRRNASRHLPQPSTPSPVQAQNQHAPIVLTSPSVEPSRPLSPAQGREQFVPSEDLPPVAPGRDRLTALGWTSGVLLVGLIMLLLAR
ncbi:MAG TPA: hypothetical protein VGU68_02755 [Ktedonobacteraceae bacterium]|nr:hypothetical protein [Ktedonobacteraceae bacterium]